VQEKKEPFLHGLENKLREKTCDTWQRGSV